MEWGINPPHFANTMWGDLHDQTLVYNFKFASFVFVLLFKIYYRLRNELQN